MSFIEVRSTDEAIIRADRAQFVAKLQEAVVKQKEELDEGIREILSILTRAANGDFTTQISLPQENVLWQIASTLNTLFTRLQRSRQAEINLRQVEQDIAELITVLRIELSGQPAQWPQPNGGPVDPLTRQLYAIIHPSQGAPQTQPFSTLPPRTRNRLTRLT